MFFVVVVFLFSCTSIYLSIMFLIFFSCVLLSLLEVVSQIIIPSGIKGCTVRFKQCYLFAGIISLPSDSKYISSLVTKMLKSLCSCDVVQCMGLDPSIT